MKPGPRIAFLISGRGSNMVAILKKIKQRKLKAEPVLVFSDKSNAAGLAKARSYGLQTHSFSPRDFSSFEEFEKNLVTLLKSQKIEWIVCAGYMRILRDTMLKAFPGKIVNIHPALLPSFPGLRAQKQAIDSGVKISGCTVHIVDSGVDTGPIVMQSAVKVEPGDNEESLSKRIIKSEKEIYWRALKLLFTGS